MALPNPGMDFTPFDTLPAASLDDMVENIESLADGSGFDAAAISAPDINFGGAGTGIWWEEIGRVTLSSIGTTMTISSIPVRKYLKLLIFCIASGGNIGSGLRFNNDSGSNYSLRLSDSGASHGTFASQSGITLDTATNVNMFCTVDIINVATIEKLVEFNTTMQGAVGAGNLTASRQGWPKWSNTSTAITRIDLVTSSANYGVGSEIVVLGHN